MNIIVLSPITESASLSVFNCWETADSDILSLLAKTLNKLIYNVLNYFS